MDSIIMIRIPNGSIAPVTGDDGEMIVYPSLDDAIADADTNASNLMNCDPLTAYRRME